MLGATWGLKAVGGSVGCDVSTYVSLCMYITAQRATSMPCRYQGRLDRYDDTGGTGYHVIYDDGDEEVLGDTIEGRDDVRLMPPEGDAHSPSEVGR